MDIPANVLTIAGIIIVVLGTLAGLLLSTLKEESEPLEEAGEPTPPGGKPGRYAPLARLWREKAGGALVVEIDGRAYIGAEALEPAQREQLERAARDLRAFLGMGIAAAQAEPDLARALEAAQPEPARQAQAPQVQVAQSYAAPYSPPPAPYSPPPVPAVRQTGSLVEPPAAPLGSKSIAMQIEDILQDLIAGTPLARRGLHVNEDPLRGVIVQVGTEYFEGIDSVTDPEAREALRAAVAAWEKTQ